MGWESFCFLRNLLYLISRRDIFDCVKISEHFKFLKVLKIADLIDFPLHFLYKRKGKSSKSIQQLSGDHPGYQSKRTFFCEKKFFLFERKGFGRGDEFSPFLGQLGTQF